MFEEVRNRRSVFRTETPLSSDASSQTIVNREDEISQIANTIQPLTEGRTPENLLVYGPPGIGKTTCVNHVLNSLEEQTHINTVGINCWQYNTRPSLLTHLLIELGVPIPRKGLPVDQLLGKFREWLDKNRGCAIVLDEFDQLKDACEVIYDLQELNEDMDKSLGLIMISNQSDPSADLDPRSQSRLPLTSLELRPYDAEELESILEDRAEAAFQAGAISHQVLSLISNIVADENGDCRKALNLLLRAGRKAEREGENRVTPKHVPQTGQASK